MWEDAHISEQYDRDDWRSYQAEALYHQLFATPRQAELLLVTRTLEGFYLAAEEMVQRPLQAIAAKYQKETEHTIHQQLRLMVAVKLFELSKLSSGRAAQLAGLSRVLYVMTMGQYVQNPLTLRLNSWPRLNLLLSPNL